MNKKNKRNVIYIIVAIFVVFAFTGCPTEENNNQSNRGLLTIAELPPLPFGVNYTIYVFPSNANMSWEAVNSAIISGNFEARGIIKTGTTNVFTLSGWDGFSFVEWDGTGNFNVILANSGGDKYDETNPMYRVAMINFTNGTSDVTFDNFVPLAAENGNITEPEERGLTINGLPPLPVGFTYTVYVFPASVNLTDWENVNDAINSSNYSTKGSIRQGTVNEFLLTIWDGFSFVEWEGSGSFVVILVNTNGDMFNAISPMHSSAMINFTDGTGSANINTFTPVVRERLIKLLENDQIVDLWTTPNESGTLSDIFSWLRNNARSNRTYRILLSKDVDSDSITISSAALNGAMNTTVIFEGTDKERVIRHIGSGSLLRVLVGGRAILNNNMTLDGSIRLVGRNELVIVEGGYFEMNDGSRIQNNDMGHMNDRGGGCLFMQEVLLVLLVFL